MLVILCDPVTDRKRGYIRANLVEQLVQQGPESLIQSEWYGTHAFFMTPKL